MARTALTRGALAVLLSTGLAAGVGVSPAFAAPAQNDAVGVPKTTAGPLGEHDLDLLQQARDAGKANVTMMLATQPGQAAAVDAAVSELGGFVGKRIDSVDYVRASVPTDRAVKAAGLTGVLAADLDETIQRDDPTVGEAGDVDAEGVLQNFLKPPYMPYDETGAAALRAADPTHDGRGITIGVIDSGVDLDHPALQETTTGERKIVDWVTATDPIVDNDRTWRIMRGTVSGPSFTASGRTWTSPKGTFGFNVFSESIATGEVGGDVNRDGDTTDTFGILYDPASHDIRVDDDQDGDFTNNPVMRPYGEKYDIEHFGTDNPETDLVEKMPYVVEFREDVSLEPFGLDEVADYVNIGIVEGAHGSHVAGIAAANGTQGTGAAPGAKIVSSRACTWGGGCTAVALFEGMADLATNRGVDIINMSIGGLPALNDGNNARARLYDNLIQTTGVQMFISAGNSGAGINTIGDPSVATDVISVGSSISKQTWKANYGSDTEIPYQLHNFSSRGPREDGGFKPNLVAPGSAISTVPQFLKQDGLAEAGYELPVGYAMFNGTSMASPAAAGAAADLLSATKAAGVTVSSAQLRKALYSTTKVIPGLQTYEQGLGLIQVDKALAIALASPSTSTFDVKTPVCTPISGFLAEPDVGSGFYNRCSVTAGGQAAGQSKLYYGTITRTSGAVGNKLFNIKMVGSDGSFSLPRTRVFLPLNKAVKFPLVVKPVGPGVHSVIVQLDDPKSPGIEGNVMGTVVTAQPLVAPSFSVGKSGTVQRNNNTSVFVDVPVGTKALQVNMSGITEGSQTRWIATNPYGVPVDSTSSRQCFSNFVFEDTPVTCDPFSRAYLDPLPGIWELNLESRRTSPQLDNPFTLTASAQGVTVSPEVLEVPTAVIGEPTPVSFDVTNNFATTTISAEGGDLGSAKTLRPTIENLAVQTYEVVVPEGATRLDASIGNVSDPASDLDLTVYNEAGEQVAQTADGDSEEAISIADPPAGTYTVEVDGYSVPSGSTEYDYQDVVLSPAFGTLTADTASTTLARGETAQVTGTLKALLPAVEGRQLFGEITVLSDSGAPLGTGTVIVGELTEGPVPDPQPSPTGTPTPEPTPPLPTPGPPSPSPSAGKV